MHNWSPELPSLARLLMPVLGVLFIPIFSPAQTAYPNPDHWQLERIPIAEELGTTDGMSITGDHNGHLWLGTNNGVARYDGYTFQNYMAIPGDSTSLIDNRVQYVFVDHRGTVWVGTRLGMARYLPEGDCFKQYDPNLNEAHTVPEGGINWIIEDQNHQLWVAGQNGELYRYERESDQFERFLYRPEDPVDLSNDQIRVLLADQDGYIWIGTGEPFVPTLTGGGLIRFHPEKGTAKRYLHDSGDEHSLIDNRVSALLQDSRGRIWVGTCDSGLHLYNPDLDRFERRTFNAVDPPSIYPPPTPPGLGPWTSCPHITVLHEDLWGGIWVGNFNGGLYRFDARGGRPRLFAQDPNDPNSIDNNNIWTFYEDPQGHFWLGNMEGGVYKINPWKKKFQVGFPNRVINGVFALSSKPDSLWIAVWGEGVYQGGRQDGPYRHFRKATPVDGGVPVDLLYTHSFFEDTEKQLWLATDHGLCRYDGATEGFILYPIGSKTNDQDQNVGIHQILEDQDGYFWLGSFGNGLYRFDKATQRTEHFPLPPQSEAGNTYWQSVMAQHEDRAGRHWVGTWRGGFYQFNRQTGEFTRELSDIGVQAVHEQENGKFWLAAGNDGLLEFDPEKGKLRSFSSKDGLPWNEIYAIREDRTGKLWMSTNDGISSFDPKTVSFSNFDRNDGLPPGVFVFFSAFKGSKGTMYFGSSKGLASFRPEEMLENTTPPLMQMRDISIFDQSLRSGAVDFPRSFRNSPPEKLRLAYDQNELTFEYVGLHYTDPSLNQYRYRLLPYDQQWIEAGTGRSARYTNLSPGTYRFEVIAANSDGYWTDTPATIDLLILPPWWASWWAYCGYVFLALLILYGLYSYQKRRWALQASLQIEQAESNRLRELDEFKSRFYSNITHEFRTPLTIIQGLAEQIRENPGKKVSEYTNLIQNNSRKLLQLINQILDLSRLEAGKSKLHYIQGDIILHLKYLVESFHSLADDRRLSISFHSEINELLMDYDPEKCRQVMDNLITNAIKFTPEYGQVKVVAKTRVEQEEQVWLEVSIRDTGRGIPAEEIPRIFDRFYQVDHSSIREGDGTGLGLALTKEWIALMDGTIRVESTIGRGSTFTFRLPVRQQAELVATSPKPPQRAPVLPISGHLEAVESQPAIHDEDTPVLLIIEDNPDVTFYLKDLLDNQYQIISCRNGRDGVEKALESIPDLIISDVMMPEMDGFAVCEKLKTDERTSHIPIILLTAKATAADKLSGLQHGADAYLTKPFDKAELMIRLEKLHEIRRKLQQKYSNDLLAGPAEESDQHHPEDQFLRKMEAIILDQLDNENFTINDLAHALQLSRSQVSRKVKALTGFSLALYLRRLRLEKAKRLLLDEGLNISEAAYRVGFKSAVYFSQVFKETYHESPSTWLDRTSRP